MSVQKSTQKTQTDMLTEVAKSISNKILEKEESESVRK